MLGVAQLAGRTIGSNVVMWLSGGTREKVGRGGGLHVGFERADPIEGRSKDPASSIGEVQLALRHHGRNSRDFPKGA